MHRNSTKSQNSEMPCKWTKCGIELWNVVFDRLRINHLKSVEEWEYWSNAITSLELKINNNALWNQYTAYIVAPAAATTTIATALTNSDPIHRFANYLFTHTVQIRVNAKWLVWERIDVSIRLQSDQCGHWV